MKLSVRHFFITGLIRDQPKPFFILIASKLIQSIMPVILSPILGVRA